MHNELDFVQIILRIFTVVSNSYKNMYIDSFKIYVFLILITWAKEKVCIVYVLTY